MESNSASINTEKGKIILSGRQENIHDLSIQLLQNDSEAQDFENGFSLGGPLPPLSQQRSEFSVHFIQKLYQVTVTDEHDSQLVKNHSYKDLNRYIDILPCTPYTDHFNQVTLSAPPHYINADYINV